MLYKKLQKGGIPEGDSGERISKKDLFNKFAKAQQKKAPQMESFDDMNDESDDDYDENQVIKSSPSNRKRAVTCTDGGYPTLQNVTTV